VLTLDAGTATATVVPFTHLPSPFGVALDNFGTVYVADDFAGVVKLPMVP
jgi:hypothetical protein